MDFQVDWLSLKGEAVENRQLSVAVVVNQVVGVVFHGEEIDGPALVADL